MLLMLGKGEQEEGGREGVGGGGGYVEQRYSYADELMERSRECRGLSAVSGAYFLWGGGGMNQGHHQGPFFLTGRGKGFSGLIPGGGVYAYRGFSP
jgi:hypothetical protein